MTLFDRVRAAFSADYEVLDEIGRGGMGAVFKAIDPALGRSVAIKVLLPEHATARAVERFVQEARAMAAVHHPHVLQVHQAGESGGLFFYVMEYVEGETLADRLKGGPLAPSELATLAGDLLDALAAVHHAGLVHRDVKPSNIFFLDDRAMLGDFGIASPVETSGADRLTAVGETLGTAWYQAPEQRRGQEATTATDLYAAGLVLYESCTGTAWYEAAASGSPWSAVPPRLRIPLQRALRPDPADRWPDAETFARAFVGARPTWRRAAAAVVVAGLVIAAVVWIVRPSPPPAVGDLAVLPFQVVGVAGRQELGRELAVRTTYELEYLPLRVIPAGQAAHVSPGNEGPLDPRVRRALRAVYVARGTIRLRGDRWEVRLVVEDSLGERLPERVILGDTSDFEGLCDSVALALLRQVAPRFVSSFRGLDDALSTRNVQALREFLLGEDYFHRNAWVMAYAHYRRALDVDSSFTFAAWRLWNVWRWQLTGREVVDLQRLSREHGAELPPVDRTLLAAEALPPGPQRIAALEDAAHRYGYDGYAWLLLGDELYNRGPLVGRSLAEAAAALGEAAARDPQLGPAYEEGVMVLTRLGRQEEARINNEKLQETAAPPEPGEPVYFPALLDQAYRERFEPEKAAAIRDRLFDASDPRAWPAMEFAARMGLGLDLPEAQLEIGRRLAASRAQIPTKANGQMAQALALMVLGRPKDALVHFDSAATLTGSMELRLQAAEWRVVLPALGVVQLSADERQRGRERLREITSRHLPLAGRAAWALSLDAAAVGDVAAARRWLSAVQDSGSDAESARLVRLARAFQAQTLDQYRRALTLSQPLLKDQFLPRRRDPFTRTVLHLVRAEAFESRGDEDAARRERMWADNQDIAQKLGGPVQAVEVDWAASPYSDRIRATLNLAVGDTVEACRLLDRVIKLWKNAEPEVAALRAQAERLHGANCP